MQRVIYQEVQKMLSTRARMLTIGERLKQQRLEKNLTLSQVSDVIKIRRKYLQAIENSNYGIFPSTVYAKGFLKNYAVFLGIDADRAIALYRRECEEKEEEILASAQKPIREPKFILTPGKIIFAVFVVTVLSLFGYFFKQYQEFAAPPFLDIQSPKDGMETSNDSVTIEGSTEIGSVVTINDQAITTDDLGNFKVTVSLRDGTNTIKIGSENGIGKKSEEYVDVFLETETMAYNSDNEDGLVEDNVLGEETEEMIFDGIEMEITISPNSAWLLIETDGEIAFSGVLVTDSIKTFKANEKIYIKTGNAGSTSVKINGVKQEKLGEEGVVESREYTIKSISDTGSSEAEDSPISEETIEE